MTLDDILSALSTVGNVLDTPRAPTRNYEPQGAY